MRILSVVTGTPNNEANWIRVGAIAALLKAHGHTVDMVSYRGHPPKEAPDVAGLPPIDYVKARSIAACGAHLRKLASDDYDLVYANQHTAALISTSGKALRVPLVFDMHGVLVEEVPLVAEGAGTSRSRMQLAKYKLMDFFDVLLADKIICVSMKMARYLQTRVPESRTAYVTNGVDLGFYKPGPETPAQKSIRKNLGLEGKFVFGYVGNLQRWQGVESLIQASKNISDEKVKVLIVGGESEERTNNLVIHKRVSRSETKDFYAVCDVLVLPRPHHPVTEIAAPTKFAEYVSMGKPVIVTNVGDAADLTRENKCGIVVEDNSPAHLAEAMDSIRKMSPSDLAKMGEASRKLAELEFDWNKIGDRLVKALESV